MHRSLLCCALSLWVSAGCDRAPNTAADAALADRAEPADEPAALDGTPDLPALPACEVQGSEVVRFATRDGVTLEAELHVPATRATRGVVLLHMVPPTNTRTNYPRAFVEQLTGRGFVVLNVDRRGAGGSEGVAQDAYLGPNGALDAAAARAFLAEHPCGLAGRFVAVVGASNGTTSMVDDAVASAEGARPAAMVFLTGGAYTDAQNPVRSNMATLGPIPSLLVYAQSERAWSEARRATAPPGWEFQEYTPGAHGSRMLTAEPGSGARVVAFLERAVPARTGP